MKAAAFFLVLLISGCSLLPFSRSGSDSKNEPVRENISVQASKSVSPEARRLVTEAQKLWEEPWSECLDAQKALSLLDKALRMDPLDTRALLLRSRALGDLGFLDDAFDDVTKAIRLSPSAEAYATRGLLLRKRGKPEGAKRDLAYAESLDPDEPLTYVFRAAGNFLEGETAKGCADLRLACEKGLCGPHSKAKKEELCL